MHRSCRALWTQGDPGHCDVLLQLAWERECNNVPFCCRPCLWQSWRVGLRRCMVPEVAVKWARKGVLVWSHC